MKTIAVILVLALYSCSDTKEQNAEVTNEQNAEVIKENTLKTEPVKPAEPDNNVIDTLTVKESKVYNNKRFRNVSVKRLSEGKYNVKGQGQIFEASFGWVVEDGHNELKKGHEMTDSGAPEWGNFDFTINVKKDRPNSTLTLILFETSAQDGSRQYELPVVLE